MLFDDLLHVRVGVALKYFLVLVCVAGSLAIDCSRFQYRPSDQQVPEGAIDASFFCLFNGSTYVAWFINGTSINEIFESPTPPMAISSGTTMLGNAAVNTLTIGALSEYSGTVVMCQAYFLTPNFEVCNATGVLSIRAPPGLVNLELHPTPTKLQLTWERSLINTDYTILYCVDIFKVVEGEETFVHAKCVVDQTSYVFSTGESEPDPNDLFQFTITPRYNVDGARNGTSMNVTGYFIAEPLTLSQDSVSVDTVISRDLLVTLTITFHNAGPWITGGGKVDEFLVEVVLDSGQPYVCSPGQPVVTSSSTLSLDANCSGLPVQRLGNVTVTAINRVGNSSLTAPISTYFVQNIRTQLCHSSQCQVEVIYDVVSDPKVPVNSLIVLENMDNDIKHYFVGENQDNATHSGGVLMSGLTKGLYNLRTFEFLLNERGLLSRIPANPQSQVINISTMADSDGSNIDKRPVHLKEFKHTGGGCFRCWFLSNSSASHCAVVVHTLDEVVNASLFERHGDRAEGCIVVDSPDWYYVVVLAYTNETIHERPYVAGKIPLLSMQGGSSISIEAILIPLAIAVVAFAVIAVIAVGAVVIWKHRQRKTTKYRKVQHDPRVTFNNLMELFRDNQIMSRWRDLGKELQFPSRRLRAMSSMEDVLNYYTTDHRCYPGWSNIQDALNRMGESQLASVVYTQYILQKAIQTQEQSDSGHYTLTTSVAEDNDEDNCILPEGKERDVFKSAQPVHKGDGPSSLATPVEGGDATEASERQVHRQATSGADGAYEEIIRDTLSSQPEGSIHISMENVHDNNDGITIIGEGSTIHAFFNYGETNS